MSTSTTSRICSPEPSTRCVSPSPTSTNKRKNRALTWRQNRPPSPWRCQSQGTTRSLQQSWEQCLPSSVWLLWECTSPRGGRGRITIILWKSICRKPRQSRSMSSTLLSSTCGRQTVRRRKRAHRRLKPARWTPLAAITCGESCRDVLFQEQKYLIVSLCKGELGSEPNQDFFLFTFFTSSGSLWLKSPKQIKRLYFSVMSFCL